MNSFTKSEADLMFVLLERAETKTAPQEQANA